MAHKLRYLSPRDNNHMHTVPKAVLTKGNIALGDRVFDIIKTIKLNTYPIPLRIEVLRDAHNRPECYLWIQMYVRSRGNARFKIWVGYLGVVAKRTSAKLAVAAQVSRMVKKLVTHEVDECLMMDGVRVFDPHVKKRVA